MKGHDNKMRIYLLNCAVTGLVFVKLLCKHLKIMGIISVNRECAKAIAEYYDYEQFCNEQKIEYITVDTYSLKSQNDKKKLMDLDIDIIITSAWQRLIPQWLINHCKIGAIGVHGSAVGISGGRGRSPQNWALILGKDRFYLSIFWIDQNIDSGDIIDTKEFKYELIDDINISYHKESICLAEMIIQNFQNGNIEKHYGIQQGEVPGYLPKRTPNDGMIDWKRKCCEIYNFVRALTIPYPCAFTKINGHVIQIIRCKYIEVESEFFDNYSCGEVIMLLELGLFWVKCLDGIIEILEYNNVDRIEIKEGQIFESSNFMEQMRMIIDRHNNEVSLPVSSMFCEYIK